MEVLKHQIDVIILHSNTTYVSALLLSWEMYLESWVSSGPCLVAIDIDIDIFINCNWVDTRWQ